MTMTNAELAAAINWTSVCLGQIKSQPGIASYERLFFDHLSDLLKIQRERAEDGLPVEVRGEKELHTWPPK